MSFLETGLNSTAVFVIVIALLAAASTFSQSTRASILFLWLTGLGVGALYLKLGAEVLAMIQWLVSTLITIGFVFFSGLFGEYLPKKEEGPRRPRSPHLIFGVLCAAGFFGFFLLAQEDLFAVFEVHFRENTDLFAMGNYLVRDSFLALELLGVTLLLALVGGGILARPRDEAEKKGDH